MHLWFRMIGYLVSLLWRPPLSLPGETSVVPLCVWLNDLDTSGHLNNGRYLTMMDLGRLDLMMRSGMWRAILRHRWTPIASAAVIRFRREIRLFQRFDLETRILCWDQKLIVIEHLFRFRGGKHDGVIAARALVTAGLYDRATRTFIEPSRLMTEVGIAGASPPPPPEVVAFLAAEDALREPSAKRSGATTS